MTPDEVEAIRDQPQDWQPHRYATASTDIDPPPKILGAFMVAAAMWGLPVREGRLYRFRYDAPNTGLDWHRDTVERPPYDTMTLSMSVQLSAADAYDGCVVELQEGGEVVAVPRTVGTVAVFRPSVTHRVTPCTAVPVMLRSGLPGHARSTSWG